VAATIELSGLFNSARCECGGFIGTGRATKLLERFSDQPIMSVLKSSGLVVKSIIGHDAFHLYAFCACSRTATHGSERRTNTRGTNTLGLLFEQISNCAEMPVGIDAY